MTLCRPTSHAFSSDIHTFRCLVKKMILEEFYFANIFLLLDFLWNLKKNFSWYIVHVKNNNFSWYIVHVIYIYIYIYIYSLIWKSDLTDKMKRSFFQAAVVSILLYGCTTWTLTKRLKKKLDGNYTRMLRAILNKSWRQQPTRHQLYGHLPPITKTIQVRRTRHAGHCWRSKDKLISDVLLWTLTYGQAKAGWPARTYIQQLCEDTECNPEDLPKAMNNREKWRERVRDIRAGGTTWWWWYVFCNLFFVTKISKETIKTRVFVIIITYVSLKMFNMINKLKSLKLETVIL